jgi:SAM-dependent methyltransferase
MVTRVIGNIENDSAESWNREYARQGIPSSHRDEPSGVLRWGLSNIPHLANGQIESAVDLGCGTGRNALALREVGIKRVDAMDFSAAALELASKRPGADAVHFSQGDVTKPLPFEDAAFDLATDIFVYFHQLPDQDRAQYRREMHRILRPGGLLLVSLATTGDGYYGSCGIGPLGNINASLRLTWDPVAEVGNILPSFAEVVDEFADKFSLQMTWLKRKVGSMHGKSYLRETIATLWTARD